MFHFLFKILLRIRKKKFYRLPKLENQTHIDRQIKKKNNFQASIKLIAKSHDCCDFVLFVLKYVSTLLHKIVIKKFGTLQCLFYTKVKRIFQLYICLLLYCSMQSETFKMKIKSYYQVYKNKC